MNYINGVQISFKRIERVLSLQGKMWKADLYAKILTG